MSATALLIPRHAPSVVLAEDNTFFRTGLAHGLRDTGLTVLGEAGTASQAVDIAARLRPDVVVISLALRGTDGVEATRRILATAPDSRVVGLGDGAGDDATLVDAVLAGMTGYLPRTTPVAQIADAVRAAGRGELPLAPEAVRAVVAGLRRTAGSGSGPRPRLSDRELDVLALLADGCANGEIAEQLVISTHTVKSHVSKLLEKLEVSNRVQAVVRAHREGLLAVDAGARERGVAPSAGR